MIPKEIGLEMYGWLIPNPLNKAMVWYIEDDYDNNNQIIKKLKNKKIMFNNFRWNAN